MAKKGFNLAEYLTPANVPESGTGREQIVYLPLAQLHADEKNFYSLDGIDDLAANIELCGLQQPLRVRPDREGYIIVSGHRRATALRKLADTEEYTYDTSKVEAFLVPKGTAIEVYATTLHYAPCNAKGEEGFRCVVILPKGTNEELTFTPDKDGEDKLLTAQNKWLIAHKEAEIPEAFCGLVGENITLS